MCSVKNISTGSNAFSLKHQHSKQQVQFEISVPKLELERDGGVELFAGYRVGGGHEYVGPQAERRRYGGRKPHGRVFVVAVGIDGTGLHARLGAVVKGGYERRGALDCFHLDGLPRNEAGDVVHLDGITEWSKVQTGIS